jgi:hypothetical protein
LGGEKSPDRTLAGAGHARDHDDHASIL